MRAENEQVSDDLVGDDLAEARRVLAVEAAGLNALSASLDAGFSAVVEKIATMSGRVIVAGVGKSGHVGKKIAATLASTGTNAQFIHPTEASHGDMGMIGSQDILLLLSKSGAAPELGDMISYAKRFEITLIAITANPDSALGKAADHILLLPDVAEACGQTAAPTTSTTMQMALGDCLAVALITRRGFTAQDFKVFHPGGKLGAMYKRVADVMVQGEGLPIADPAMTLREVLMVMSAGRLGCAVVCEDGQLLGLITDGDIRRHFEAETLRGVADSLFRADNLMSENPMTTGPNMLAAEALATLNRTHRTMMPVVEGQKLVGIIHLHDLLAAGLA